MSYTETHQGCLIPVTSGDPEEFAKKYIVDVEDRQLSEYDTYLEMLLEEYYNNFIMINNKLYSIQDNELEEANWHQYNSDGSIDYCIQFYNGGASFTEALKYELEDVRGN